MKHPTIAELRAFGDHAGVAAHAAGCPDCRRMAELLGVTLPAAPDPYLNRTLVGEGGMGRIFRAFDDRLGRTVAIKEIGAGAIPGVDRRVLRARLTEEAELTARLQHPGIVPVYEAGLRDGEPWYAMPLVEGVPLDAALADAPALVDRLLLLPRFAAVCEAVAYAHDRGVVHRDLKPANVLLGAFGETLVIDWGLAREVADPSAEPLAGPATVGALTRLGAGTVGYVAPEQVAGAAPHPRADVYALGATLHHLLSGRPPGTPPAPLAPAVPADLRSVVARAMAQDPSDRYADAGAIAAELRRWLGGQLLETHRYGPAGIVRHLARRYRAPLSVGAVAMIALTAGGAVALWRVWAEQVRATSAEHAARLDLSRALGARASLRAAGPATVDAVLDGVRAVGLARSLGEPAPAEALDGLREALAAPVHALQLEGHHGWVYAATLGDGTVAIAGNGSTVRFWPPGARRPARVAEVPVERPSGLRTSPDGARLLVFGRDAVVVVAADGAVLAVLPDAGTGNFGAWLDDERIVVGDSAGRARLWGWQDGSQEVAGLGAAVTVVAADHGEPVLGTADGGLWTWAPPASPHRFGAHRGEIRSIVPRAHDRVVGSRDGEIRVWGGDGASRVRWTGAPLDQVVLSDDGSHLVAHLPDGGIRMGRVDGGEPLLAAQGEGTGDTPVEFLAGGTIVAFRDLDSRGLFYDPEAGTRVAVFDGHAGPGQVRAVRTDGVAVSTSRDDAWLLDLWTIPRVRPALGEIVLLGERAGAVWAISVDGTVSSTPLAGGPTLTVHRFEDGVSRAASCADELWVGDFAGGLWSLSHGAPVERSRHGGPVRLLTCDPAGEVLAGWMDGTVRQRAVEWAAAGPVTGGASSSDGTTAVVLSTGGRAEVWRGADRLGEVMLPEDAAVSATFSPDDGALAIGGTAATTIVEVTTGLPPVGTVDGRGVGWPEGWGLLTDLGDGTLARWTPTGERLGTLAGHLRPVTSVTPDGTSLATTSLDHHARWWTPDGAPGVVLTTTSDATALAILADGDWVAVGAADGSVRLEMRDPTVLLAQGCALLERFGVVGESGEVCTAQNPENQTAPR